MIATWVWLTQSHTGIIPSPYGTSTRFPAMTSFVLFLRSLPRLGPVFQFFFLYSAIWRHHATFHLPTCSSAFQRTFFLRDSLPEFVLELLSIILNTCPAQCDILTCIFQSNVFVPSVHIFVYRSLQTTSISTCPNVLRMTFLKETGHLCGTLRKRPCMRVL